MGIREQGRDVASRAAQPEKHQSSMDRRLPAAAGDVNHEFQEICGAVAASRPGRGRRYIGGPLLAPGKGRQRDNAAMERRGDVAVLTGAPLDRDLDLIGPVSATVHVRTSTGHGDLFVRLCDVDVDGVSRNVTDGIRRIAEPGIVRAEVEMHPTGYRFRRGHRLRLVLAGGAFPRFARNPGTGEPIGRAVAMRRTAFEVFRDASRPSTLTLPIWRG